MKKLAKKEVVFSRARGEAFQGAFTRRGGRDLAVILPGLNYGCDRPLLAEIHYPGFSLIGGCDPSLEISRSAEYRGISGLTHLEVAGMDHGWEHEDGEAASVRGLRRAMAALDDWL